MAYTPHTWQANELVTPEKLNAIEIGLGNTVSNSGNSVINGSLKVTGLRTVQDSNASSAQLLFNDKNDSQLAEILVSENAHQMFFRIYATDHQNSSNDGKYRQYFFETTPTGLSSQETWKILSTKNVVDNLTSTSTTDVLSAAMGKQLNDNKLSLSGGTITGTLNIINDHNLYFLRDNDSIKSGFIHNDSSGRFYFYEYPATNISATDHDNREYYYLPTPDTNRTTTKGFAILTTKNLVTIAQGGTGADTSAAARTNLGITPANIGALALSGGTLTGGLTTNNLHVKGLVYFYINSSSNNTSYLRFSRDDTTSNISGRIAVSATGQFSIRLYPSDNTTQNDSASEFYYLQTPATNLTSQKNYLILTTRSLVTVAQGGTGISATDAHKVFIGPTSGNSAAPSWRILEPNDIPSLNASKITTGTLAVSRGGTGVSTTSANYVFAGPSDKADAPSFRKLQAVDIPSLTKSKISDINFGDATLQYSSNNTAGNTISVPNGRGIIIISRAVSDEDDKIGIYHVAKGVTTIHYNGGLAEGKSPGITVSKAGSTSNFSITVNSLSNHQYRITWFLYT